MKTRTRNRTHRSPRNALLFVAEAAGSVLKDAPDRTPAELVAALVRIERLALEGLYPVGQAPCPVCRGDGGPAAGDLDSDGVRCRNCGE